MWVPIGASSCSKQPLRPVQKGRIHFRTSTSMLLKTRRVWWVGAIGLVMVMVMMMMVVVVVMMMHMDKLCCIEWTQWWLGGLKSISLDVSKSLDVLWCAVEGWPVMSQESMNERLIETEEEHLKAMQALAWASFPSWWESRNLSQNVI